MKGRYIALGAIVLVIGALIAGRLYLPYWLTDHVNKVLDNIPGYHGSVENIDVHLYRGAYKIYGLKVEKTGGKIPVPFINIATTDLSIQWGALFKGRVVSDIHMNKPVLNFATSGAVSQTGDNVNWKSQIDKLMPIEINVVTFNNGKVAYRDFTANPPVNIDIHSLNGQLENLRNVDDKNVRLPSTLKASGTSIGDGKMQVNGKLNVLRKTTDMDMDFKLENASLPAFNTYVRDSAGIDFEKGTLSIYSEFAVKDGALNGYIKPIATDISIVDIEKDASNPVALIWESFVSIVMEIFENQSRDQFATKIEISGKVDSIDRDFWSTIAGIFRNAFVQAFDKGTEGEVVFQ
jgi:hypothetical protein